MSDFAYHMEALRKARVLERKCQSQSRSGLRQSNGNDYYGNPNDLDVYQPRYEMDQRDLNRPVEVRQGTGYDRITLPPSARYTDAKVQHGIYRDLKRQEKILRDHNLVMGPMSSFSEYFDASSYNPHRSAVSHY